MGCSASCVLFEKFSSFLEWAIRFKSRKESIEHYLDDFLLARKAGSGECLHLMNIFRSICSDIGVPLAEDKMLGPSCIMTFLGLEIDTIERVIQISKDKLLEVKEKLEFTLNKKKITLKFNLWLLLLISVPKQSLQYVHSIGDFVMRCVGFKYQVI